MGFSRGFHGAVIYQNFHTDFTIHTILSHGSHVSIVLNHYMAVR